MAKVLFKGNDAIAEAAVLGGCRYYFGYPITPQTEISEYLAKRLFEVGGDFIQAESEVAAINMVYGAAGSGARAMTSSSSPGMSLKQEGLSYIAGARIPCVVVDMMRSGPGLGGILPSQSDYFQMVKGGGHGDYRLLVLAPSTVQEAVDMMYTAFDKAEQYRIPVCILGDGMLGQIAEPVEFPPAKQPPKPQSKEWATTGEHSGAQKRVVNSLFIDAVGCEKNNLELQAIYRKVAAEQTDFEEFMCEDAEYVFAAYGTIGRICKSAVRLLRQSGVKAGLLRPKTLWPFPTAAFERLAALPRVKKFICVELSAGQFVEDVKLSVLGKKPVEFYGRIGGTVCSAEDIAGFAKEVIK